MYDDNPTIQHLVKTIDPMRQGEVLDYKAQSGADNGKRFYIESFGCQMNFSDSEIVAAVLHEAGYRSTLRMEEADLILVNTCSIREKAEDTVRKRLYVYNKVKKSKPGTLIGVLGCMAERMKRQLLEEEKLVDLVVGPDAYRDMPKLLDSAEEGHRAINVQLSREETYADISPVRLQSNGVTAFISIMRGCDNMCSFCVVPFTRGRERSRDPYSIIAETRDLYDNGYREVTLLGQNVDSYNWVHPETQETVTFARLLRMCAGVHPEMRIRFSTSHPKDMTDEVLYAMAEMDNICNYIHLPVQSGNNRILELMRRGYTREWYMERIEAIRRIIPDCAISSDIIAGFCTETEADHRETLDIIRRANFSMSYMFYYSERPNTFAQRNLQDNVPLEVKKRRLTEIIQLQNTLSLEHNKKDIGRQFEVLIEGDSKKSKAEFKGRNSQNKMVVFPKIPGLRPGDYVHVEITEASSATLRGHIIQNSAL